MFVATAGGDSGSVSTDEEDCSMGIWKIIYESVQPSFKVGAGVFPCISGRNGAVLRFNVGVGTSGSFAFKPPTTDFKPAIVALERQVSSPCCCSIS